MTEEQFWKLVELARQGPAGAFQLKLQELSDVDLEEFVAEYHAQKRRLMKPEFLSAITEPKTQQHLADIAEWVVAQGLDYFEAIFFGDQKFPEGIPGDGPAPHLDQGASAVYKKRTNRWVPRRAPASDDIELDQEKFWHLVDLAQNAKPAFTRALEELRPEDLIAFYWEIDAVRRAFAAPQFQPYLDPAVTGNWESWMSFTDWLFSLGRERVDAILKDPRMMPSRLPDGASGHPVDRDVERVFNQRFAEDLPLQKRES
jgi:hypothetical protein